MRASLLPVVVLALVAAGCKDPPALSAPSPATSTPTTTAPVTDASPAADGASTAAQALPATALAGTVVDSAGQPIAGAAIEILPVGMVSPPATTTDAAGHFASRLSVGSWRIKVSKKGRSETWVTQEIAEGQSAVALTITVPEAASLVVDTDCKACVGAFVSVSVGNHGFSSTLRENGAATFTGLPVGDAVVTLHHDKDPRRPMHSEAPVKLTPGAESRATLKVTALAASANVTGVLVERDGKCATTAGGGQLVVDVMFRGFQRRVVAAANGTFTVPNVLPGECTLTGLRIDPTNAMSGANGGRTETTVVAPATRVGVKVNDFFHASDGPPVGARDCPGEYRAKGAVRAGAALTKGGLSPEVIRRVVHPNLGRLRSCYELGLRANPKLEGRVVVKFVIDPSGAVSSAQEGNSDLQDAGVVVCVLGAFRRMKFPRPESGSVTVTYPVMFSPGE